VVLKRKEETPGTGPGANLYFFGGRGLGAFLPVRVITPVGHLVIAVSVCSVGLYSRDHFDEVSRAGFGTGGAACAFCVIDHCQAVDDL